MDSLMFFGGFSMFFLLIVLGVIAFTMIRVLNEYERGVVFRLGRVMGAKGPGLMIFDTGDR